MSTEVILIRREIQRKKQVRLLLCHFIDKAKFDVQYFILIIHLRQFAVLGMYFSVCEFKFPATKFDLNPLIQSLSLD